MAFEVDLEELQKEEIIDANKILNEYFNPKNINLKTEINAPVEFTLLNVITKNFNDLINFGNVKKDFKFCKRTLNDFLDLYKQYMISHTRKSRSEVADVLKAMKEQQSQARGLIDKLTGMGKG